MDIAKEKGDEEAISRATKNIEIWERFKVEYADLYAKISAGVN